MLINGRFLGRRTTGVQRFAREILRSAGLEGALPNSKILTPATALYAQPDYFGLPLQSVGALDGHAWEQFDLSRAAKDDFLINLCSTAPIWKKRQLVVLHDIIFASYPQNFTPMFRAWYQVMTRLYARRSTVLATVSRFSAAEIARYYDVPLGRIEVIPESGEHILREAPDESVLRKHALAPGDYFVAVSSMAENKNFKGLVEALKDTGNLPAKCVIVGGQNARVFSSAPTHFSDAIEVGYVTDAQLRALYENAACFIYPSFYEGFGLPPLEAMSCGCPVIVSDSTSLPETCGKAAVYCNPRDKKDIAGKLRSVLESRTLRQELRERGLERSGQYTWAKGARALTDILTKHP